MKITTEQHGSKYHILNKGKIIACSTTNFDHLQALRLLERLADQLQRAEAFCDCKPKQEGLR